MWYRDITTLILLECILDGHDIKNLVMLYIYIYIYISLIFGAFA